MYAKKFLLMMVVTSSLLAAKAQVKTKEEIRKERAAKLQKLKSEEDETAIIFNKQNAFGIRLNTDGYGVFYEHGKYKTLSLTNLWWVSLDERKDPKEERIANSDNSGQFQVGNPFVYGKINNFYQLKIGFGQQRLIGGKDIKNGVAFSVIYGGGITAGLIKPYYLNITDSVNHDIRYSSQTDSIFRNYGNINGGSSFGKGFSEIKFVPGVFARAALRFDYGTYNELLSAIEAGITAQYYTKDIQIMIDQPGKKFFFNAYVALIFGKRK